MKDGIKIVELKISEVTPFAGYPFRLTDDEEMYLLEESILTKGIQTPLKVRMLEKDRYEIIDGHRRFYAIRRIGLFDSVPAIVSRMHDDEAVIAFVKANISKDLSISQQAILYSMGYDALHEQVERTGKRPMKKGKRQALDYALADIVGKSRGDLHRYFRLKYVISEILDLVDTNVVALATAVEISFLSKEQQKWISGYMNENGAVLSYQIFAIRNYLKVNDKITRMEMIRILNENAPKDLSNRFQRIELTKPTLRKYFPPFYTKSQMENVIFKLLEEWHKENVEDD
ncbi:MAG: ParB N-terminal domain-containing protein [Lachnospiraceae bacterium]|nr:ParB N-terminal domain-containing protein [Lachnospiraceae bacterium]